MLFKYKKKIYENDNKDDYSKSTFNILLRLE